jgi:hypothetical protein
MKYDTEKMRSNRRKSIDKTRMTVKQRDIQRKRDRARKYEVVQSAK